MQRISKTISEFLVPVVTPDDPVTKAVDIMRTRRTDCAMVFAEGKLVGIFTERDFLFRVAAQKRNPSTTPMRDVMTPKPETLRAHDSIAYAINRMAVRGIRNLPIVDDQGRAISVLDIRHVIDHMAEVFTELEDRGFESLVDEWTDIGGG